MALKLLETNWTPQEEHLVIVYTLCPDIKGFKEYKKQFQNTAQRSGLPVNVLDALALIDSYCETRIKKEHGIDVVRAIPPTDVQKKAKEFMDSKPVEASKK